MFTLHFISPLPKKYQKKNPTPKNKTKQQQANNLTKTKQDTHTKYNETRAHPSGKIVFFKSKLTCLSLGLFTSSETTCIEYKKKTLYHIKNEIIRNLTL